MNLKPLNQQQHIIQVPRNERVLKASQMYEEQFLREMVKAMRATVPEGGLVQRGQGEKIFQEQLDEQYVEQWTQKGGIGFADMIYDHIMERYFSKTPSRPKGPLNPEHKGTIQKQPQGVLINYDKLKSAIGIRSPWEGELQQEVVGQLVHSTISHDNGLESHLLYSGPSIMNGGRVLAGEKIGVSEPNNAVVWSVRQTQEGEFLDKS